MLLVLLVLIDTAPTEIYTLSLHDALPISRGRGGRCAGRCPGSGVRRLLRDADHAGGGPTRPGRTGPGDRKSTRLNSSHRCISYAVFCLKKKKTCCLKSNGCPVPVFSGRRR